MVVCIHCALKAYVNDDPPESALFPHETPEEHMARHHPDPAVTARERAEWESKATRKLQTSIRILKDINNT